MIVAAFVLFFLPETRDRTLEEIHEMFEAKLGPRQFKGYVCVGVEEMASEGVAKGDAVLGKGAEAMEVEMREVRKDD